MYKVIVKQEDGLAELTLKDGTEFDKSLVVADYRIKKPTKKILDQLKKDDVKRKAANAEIHERLRAKAYLVKTDWYIIRELDTGVRCPEDIKIKRQEAREKIN